MRETSMFQRSCSSGRTSLQIFLPVRKEWKRKRQPAAMRMTAAAL
jgi:hypothetical protein